MVESEHHEDARVLREYRYYIAALDGEAKAFANAVRAHWGVENRLHWVLDVTFREDECRIRRANARPTSTPSVNSPFDSSRFYSPADTAAD